MTQFGADGSTNLRSYQKPCLWLDGKDKLHLPKPGETTINCDENSMIIRDPPTPQDDSDGGSNHSASSGRSLKDNVWNRTFHGHPGERNTAEKVGWKVAHSVKSLLKSAGHLVKSCFDESNQTQFRRRSASSSYGSGTSLSSSYTIRQRNSNPSEKETSEGRDGSRSVKGGWMRRVTANVGSGVRMLRRQVKRQDTESDRPCSVHIH